MYNISFEEAYKKSNNGGRKHLTWYITRLQELYFRLKYDIIIYYEAIM
jgi:hypothetical protein